VFTAKIQWPLDELDEALEAEQPRDSNLDGIVDGAVQKHEEEVADMKIKMDRPEVDENKRVTMEGLKVDGNRPNQPE
jgi:hypothetical protein